MAGKPIEKPGDFIADVEAIRRRARSHIEDGAVTSAYRGNREAVIRLLNDALATEIVCVLRYKRHHFMATGIHAAALAEEFAEHAEEEQQHADKLAERITQLGGEPNFNPEGITDRSHSQYVEGTTLTDMIREDLIAERIAIDSYQQMIRFIGENDPTSRRVLEEILEVEEEHAEDMRTALESVDRESQPFIGKSGPRKDADAA